MTWRDHLPVHPAAELFPALSPDDLRQLGEDIKANGVRQRVVVEPGENGEFALIVETWPGFLALDELIEAGLTWVDELRCVAAKVAR
jgi:hypothetical protein